MSCKDSHIVSYFSFKYNQYVQRFFSRLINPRYPVARNFFLEAIDKINMKTNLDSTNTSPAPNPASQAALPPLRVANQKRSSSFLKLLLSSDRASVSKRQEMLTVTGDGNTAVRDRGRGSKIGTGYDSDGDSDDSLDGLTKCEKMFRTIEGGNANANTNALRLRRTPTPTPPPLSQPDLHNDVNALLFPPQLRGKKSIRACIILCFDGVAKKRQ